ncbi:MAG: DMT family transporter [Phycisphaerales bacterium]
MPTLSAAAGRARAAQTGRGRRLSQHQTGRASRYPGLEGAAMILFTLAGWTSIPIFLRWFKHDIDGWTANGWRYGFSALMWLPVLVWGGVRGTLPKGLFRAAAIPSFFNVLGQICFGLAPYYISPGLMTFSLRFQIIFLTLGVILLFPSERRIVKSAGYLVGVGMVLAGTMSVLLLREGGIFEARGGDRPVIGVSLALGAGLLYAGYAISVRKFMTGIPAFTAFSAVSQYTGVALLGCMAVWGERSGAVLFDLTNAKILLVLLSAIIGIGIGHTLYYASINRLGLAVSSGVVQLQPITVSIVSYFVFGEKLSPAQWGVGLLAIGGAGLILYTQHRMSKAVQLPVDPVD